MGFSNERMRTGQLVNWFLLDGLELTPAGNPITRPQELPFGIDHLIGFNELLTCKHPENTGVHFFLDDYQFERFWRQPERYVAALARFPLVIGPDFSLYTDFPAPIQHWNHYRNQLLTAWLQNKGLCTIPAASWSDEESFRWCFDGIAPQGAVAVSTVGCLVHKDALHGLLRGVEELIRQTDPTELLVYGKTPPEMAALLRTKGIPWQPWHERGRLCGKSSGTQSPRSDPRAEAAGPDQGQPGGDSENERSGCSRYREGYCQAAHPN